MRLSIIFLLHTIKPPISVTDTHTLVQIQTLMRTIGIPRTSPTRCYCWMFVIRVGKPNDVADLGLPPEHVWRGPFNWEYLIDRILITWHAAWDRRTDEASPVVVFFCPVLLSFQKFYNAFKKSPCLNNTLPSNLLQIFQFVHRFFNVF